MGLRIRPVERENDARISWSFGWRIFWFSKKNLPDAVEKRHGKLKKFSVTFILICIFLFSIATLWIPRLDTLPHLNDGDRIPRHLIADIEFDAVEGDAIDEHMKRFVSDFPLILVKPNALQEEVDEKIQFFMEQLKLRFQCEKDGQEYKIPSGLDNTIHGELAQHVQNLPKELCNFFSNDGDINQKEESFRIRVFKSRLKAAHVWVKDEDPQRTYPSAKEFKVVGEDNSEGALFPMENLLSPKDAAECILDDEDYKFLRVARSPFAEIVALFLSKGILAYDEECYNKLLDNAKMIEVRKFAPLHIKKYHKGDEIFPDKIVLSRGDLAVYDAYREALNNYNNPLLAWWKASHPSNEDVRQSDGPSDDGNIATQEQNTRRFTPGTDSQHAGTAPTFGNALKTLLNELYPKIFQVFMILVFCCIYLRNAHPELSRNFNSLWLIGFIVCLTLVCMIFSVKMWSFIPYSNKIDDYLLLPFALPALILVPIFGSRVALFSGLYVTAISAVALTHNQFETVMLGLVVSGCVSLAVRNISDAGNFIVHGFIAGFFPTLLAVFFFDNGNLLEEIIRFMNMGGIGDDYRFQVSDFLSVTAVNLMTPVIAFVILTILDKCSRYVVTNLSYPALIDTTNNKLLTRLRKEATGTYHHSVAVASLAAAAADKIHANSLKVRAYAYYHDIGKLDEPKMFTENDAKHEAHNGLTPEESAAHILRHVDYGVEELGRIYHLKSYILRAIAQHHGDDIVSYFYNKEAEATGKEPQREKFAYKGPRPYEKEIAILMLADCCEAASNSLQNPTEDDIRDCVTKIFLDKYKNHQLDNTKLSLKELAEIRDVFVTELSFMRHSRISYNTSNSGTVRKQPEEVSPK